MKVHLILLATLLLSGFLAAQTEGTPPPVVDDGKLKKFGSIITWGKAKQAYDEGMKAFHQSKGDEAVAKFTEALSHIDRYTDARFARGRTYYETRKWAAALEDFTRVVAEQPERADGHYHRGLALWNLKRPEDALKEFDIAIGQAPRSYQFRESRASLLTVLKQHERALADYDMMVGLQPLWPSNLERRARHLREMGRVGEAEEDERLADQLREAGF
jgi:tetratricopeptide (TPR) repeat protein